MGSKYPLGGIHAAAGPPVSLLPPPHLHLASGCPSPDMFHIEAIYIPRLIYLSIISTVSVPLAMLRVQDAVQRKVCGEICGPHVLVKTRAAEIEMVIF